MDWTHFFNETRKSSRGVKNYQEGIKTGIASLKQMYQVNKYGERYHSPLRFEAEAHNRVVG
ncbi:MULTISPECIES: hypothetical protein [unclassified Lysinibacillus]|uniref:hypothetical protein n=1 Tax=unclassified Lysinibacillus TaxID=2636778 RepID=UPI0038063262